MQLVY